jgi:hypothetical protein
MQQAIYEASSKVKLAIAPPRIIGVIKECGGKMWMGERTLSGPSLGTIMCILLIAIAMIHVERRELGERLSRLL